MNSSTLFRKITYVVAALLSSLFARAATVPDPVSGDLYLAFRASGGDGASDSYIVKLGQDTPFRTASAGSSFAVSGLGAINLDLESKYGTSWHTRSDLHWAVFGVRPSASPILYASRARIPVGTNATPWSALEQLSRSGTASQITSVLESIGGYKGLQATENSSVSAFQVNVTQNSSYNFQVATPGTDDFGSLSTWSTIEGNFGAGASGTALDLFRIAGSGVTRVGKFSISSAGTVTFTAPAAANVDTDNDGFLDSEEAVAGTNPNDASSFFKAIIASTPTGAGISFATIPARTYSISYSQDLTSNSWSTIHTFSSAVTPETVQFIDTDPVRKARSKGFYRVIVNQ